MQLRNTDSGCFIIFYYLCECTGRNGPNQSKRFIALTNKSAVFSAYVTRTMYGKLQPDIWSQLSAPQSTQKIILGAPIPIDNESLFRLPNQSKICETFINSYYLDWDASTTNANSISEALGVPKPPLPRPSKAPWSTTGGWSEPSAVSSHNSRAHSSYPLTGRTSGRDVYYENASGATRVTLYTFTTPLYPANYPAQIDCIKIIRGDVTAINCRD
ncbi:unnamed protein product [Echinostoma caproni]|uniref:CUB domain-containing protein n=1 Tax=Echinostoma caproni TaxID=27848 RepID=A0A183A6R1_9TREM|nr:unnamed protein product [Echinostoma caproni]